MGAPTAIGKRLQVALGYADRTEKTALLPSAEALGADAKTEGQEQAKVEAEQDRPGLTIFTDGSRANSGAAGYAAVCKSRSKWVGLRTHTGYNQCAVLQESWKWQREDGSSRRGSRCLLMCRLQLGGWYRKSRARSIRLGPGNGQPR